MPPVEPPSPAPPADAPPAGVSYFETSRQPWLNFMFIAPLMGLYEFGLLASDAGMNNAVNSALKIPFLILGKEGLLWFNAALIPVFFWFGCRHEDEGAEIGVKLYTMMAAESLAWGLLLSGATLLPLKTLWPNSLAAPFHSRQFIGITLSMGAGVYEEILFRHILAGMVYLYLVKGCGWTGWREAAAVVLCLLSSSAIFSAMHYYGPLGDAWNWTSFIFRFGAGIALGLIYFTRGLGIAVYAHAIYDVLLVLGLV